MTVTIYTPSKLCAKKASTYFGVTKIPSTYFGVTKILVGQSGYTIHQGTTMFTNTQLDPFEVEITQD